MPDLPSIIILSENGVIQRTLEENINIDCDFDLLTISGIGGLNQYHTIHVLINDLPHPVNASDLPGYKIRALINLNILEILPREIKLSMPICLHEILDILQSELSQDLLFIPLASNCVYDERDASIKFSEFKRNLTEKENDIIGYLVRNAGSWVAKESCYNHIWGQNAELLKTTTMDTHLQNLKSKLPTNMLEMRPGEVRLASKQ